MLLTARLTRITNLPRRAMGSAYAAYAAQNGSAGQHTVTALGRWSILNKQLPPVDSIKAIHVYDFDNTRRPSKPKSHYGRELLLTRFVVQFSKLRFQTPRSGMVQRLVHWRIPTPL